MRYLHTMLRVRNLDAALKFYSDALGLKEVRRIDNDKGRFTLLFLCAPEDEHLLKSQPATRGAPLVELTYNWDEETYGEDRFFGVQFAGGIRSITISNSAGGIEVDHIQYGAMAPVPEPGSWALMAAGLGLLARRRLFART